MRRAHIASHMLTHGCDDQHVVNRPGSAVKANTMLCCCCVCVVVCACVAQIDIAGELRQLGMAHEAEEMLRAVFELSVKAQGPRGPCVRAAYRKIMLEQLQGESAAAFRARAVELGCNVEAFSAGIV